MVSCAGVSKRVAKEKELDDIYKKLKEKHDDKYSIPQLRLWAWMIVAKTHDDLDNPPQVPMITGPSVPQQPRESLTEVVTCAASAIAKALSPTRDVPPSSHPVKCSPTKVVDIRMKS